MIQIQKIRKYLSFSVTIRTPWGQLTLWTGIEPEKK